MFLTIYNLIPKWLLIILLLAALASGAYIGIKMEYYKIANAKLTNDNKIYADNEVVYKSQLQTCTQSLAAEKKNAERTEAIHTVTQQHQNDINSIYVKEGANAKTDIKDAIVESNKLSDRFNAGSGVRNSDQSNSSRYSNRLFLAYAPGVDYDPTGSPLGSANPGPLVR